MNKRIRYIINPMSGTKGKEEIPFLIEKLTDRNDIDFEICLTKAAKHATELAQEAASKNYDIVVAVGGDGSANETAKGLFGSNTALGIIPTGSGNGMARHLKIPMDTSEAVLVINNAHLEKVDTISVNNEFCLGTIGIGFDAHIAHLFSQAKTRGYSTYVKLVLTEFYKYKSKLFLLNVDGKEIKRECFLLTFANSSQFGNNAVIAPFADVQDGIIEVSMMSKFPVFVAPHLIYRLMNNIIHQSRYFDMAKGKSIIVKNQGELQGHIDGEPVTFHGDLNIQIAPSSLTMVVPRGL
ncbi:MAG: diacylglycerol kinase family protein [Bacteroidota bacterium]